MKIVQITPSLASGGAERFVVDLSNALASMGHEITLIKILTDPEKNLSFYQKFLSPEVKIVDLGIEKRQYLKGNFSLKKHIDQIKPDVVHCHLHVVQFLAFQLFTPQIPFLMTLHSLAENTTGPYTAKFYKWLYKTGRLTPVTISEMCHDSYVRFFGLNNDTIIENGRSPITATENLEKVQAEIESLKPSPEAKVFAHIARCNPLKNQKMLIEAFNTLNAEKIPFVLLIIGNGFDSELGKELKKIAKDNIHFLGEKSNVGDYLLCSDAFCLSSEYEGLPISLLEAMSVGCTPISTRAGGVVDVITDGVTGFLSPDFTSEAYVDTVKRFLADSLEKEKIKQVYEARFSMDRCAGKYLELYQKLLKSDAKL